MGIHAYAMGDERIRREPQRGGREDVSTWLLPLALMPYGLVVLWIELYCGCAVGVALIYNL
jgi:hypothetical protein